MWMTYKGRNVWRARENWRAKQPGATVIQSLKDVVHGKGCAGCIGPSDEIINCVLIRGFVLLLGCGDASLDVLCNKGAVVTHVAGWGARGCGKEVRVVISDAMLARD